ncbi:hypothetical protein ACERZ8_00915 [Tateyamaria armeniaca]|uniref:Uncharacterized protein n=1 Tax=Tateyamaria armeniaca TaxID=2518930 RepID=A0ABW8UNP9_9RHOB
MLNSLKKSFVGVVCFAVFTVSVFADETVVDGMRNATLNDVKGLIGRQFSDGRLTMSRSGSTFHQTGTRVFRASVVGRFRGVVSQADVITLDGEIFEISGILPIPRRGYPGYIALRTGSAQLAYSIRYSDLLPLALIADAGATSLYSLTSDINDSTLNSATSINQWAAEAGMVIFQDQEEVSAIEIAGTPIHYALRFADLCNSCESGEITGFADAINRQNGVSRTSNTTDDSWIISDVGVRFEAIVSSNELGIDGIMTRNRWSIGDGQDTALVTSVSALSAEIVMDFYLQAAEATAACLGPNPPADCIFLSEEVFPQLYENAIREASLLRLNPDSLLMENGNLDFMSIGQKGAQAITRAEIAFETLALLRHAKAVDPNSWRAFMSSMSTDQIMEQNLQDWRRYAGALQSSAR